MNSTDRDFIITYIKEKPYCLNEIIELLPINRNLVNAIIKNADTEIVEILLHIPNFYQHVDQTLINDNLPKISEALHIFLKGYPEEVYNGYFSENDDEMDNLFFKRLIMNSVTLSGINKVFTDERCEDEDFEIKKSSIDPKNLKDNDSENGVNNILSDDEWYSESDIERPVINPKSKKKFDDLPF